MSVPVAKRLKALESENAKLKKLLAEAMLEKEAVRVVGMSASAYRYQPSPDRNVVLREQIVALAHRHRRYGSGMIYLKLR
jgi:hypothetical protein